MMGAIAGAIVVESGLLRMRWIVRGIGREPEHQRGGRCTLMGRVRVVRGGWLILGGELWGWGRRTALEGVFGCDGTGMWGLSMSGGGGGCGDCGCGLDGRSSRPLDRLGVCYAHNWEGVHQRW
jgi:hypothetical protein